MGVKSRLDRLRNQAGVPADTDVHGDGSTPPATDTRPSSLGRRLARLRPERAKGVVTVQGQHGRDPARAKLGEEQLAERLGGKLVAEGVIRILRRVPLGGHHGRLPLSRIRDRGLRLPNGLDAASGRRIYLDTETTGLSGSSGTIAFLIGMATVTGAEVLLVQTLLCRFSSEVAMLTRATAKLSGEELLVSYNGKTYDLPLLITRFRMQGLEHPFEGIAHLDLLHPVRRLYRKSWPDCRLATVERRLLGFERVDDLPGAEAPAAWFDYIRSGDAGRLVRVVEHNYWDILSLVAAHGALGHALAPRRVAELGVDADATGLDIEALARWLAEQDEGRALEVLETHRGRLGDGGKRLWATLLRRAGRVEQAVVLWEELHDRGCPVATEHLAKYHEHIGKDLDRALHYCRHLPPSPEREHRLRRILSK